MPGDKLKRVKSVKKWLDKAENSYLNNKDISGELNLMMAQAEMQRLKETHPHSHLFFSDYSRHRGLHSQWRELLLKDALMLL